MSDIEKTSFILDTWEELRKELASKGIIIDNEQGAANAIILSLAKCYGEGQEQGKVKGRQDALDTVKDYLEQIK